MRPVFCGNFEYDTRHSDLERLFSRYGRVDRIDMKSGFAFVYYEDERDAEDAIRALDNAPFGYSKRRLSVEWSRGDRGRYRDDSRGIANARPTKTLFVINFDPLTTRTRDIERHFEPYGKVLNVRIRRNFAFVQFDSQEEATKALECTNMSKLLDRVVSVEYAHRDDGEPGDRYDSTRRGFEEATKALECTNMSKLLDRVVSVEYAHRDDGEPGDRYDSTRRGFGRRGDSPYDRSLSPVRRSRPSPDYGPNRSPVYDRYSRPYDRSRSPDYGRYRR
ncbi:hypothetical protein HPP92_020646 [Vanilla planifolia]|uniref:RRM domain-containing protein n=1 Tax=Vanilla planifolia TaxID=51239 RepID=A0A835PXE9_VANPL|nr:hypothetical protein HPP92_020646 [Vanilla planifolia]